MNEVKTIVNGVSVILRLKSDRGGFHVTIIHACGRHTIGSIYSYGTRQEAIKEAEYYAAQRMGFYPSV